MYAEMQKVNADQPLGVAEYQAKMRHSQAGQESQQSEVERELRKLLETAEELDNTASKLIACIEKVTRPEPPVGASTAADNRLAACPGTTLGRDLDGLNNRFRATMTALQSTIQRIEL